MLCWILIIGDLPAPFFVEYRQGSTGPDSACSAAVRCAVGLASLSNNRLTREFLELPPVTSAMGIFQQLGNG